MSSAVFTDVPAFGRIFQSHYCERSQQVAYSYDLARVTELGLTQHFVREFIPEQSAGPYPLPAPLA